VLIGDNNQALLCDFGLFHLKRESAKAAHGNLVDTYIGHPFWMSPECLEGRKPDQRSDIYSFGVVILEVRQQHLTPP